MLLTFEIFKRAENHGQKFLKLSRTSFSGIAHLDSYLLTYVCFISKRKSKIFDVYLTKSALANQVICNDNEQIETQIPFRLEDSDK